jgi:carboxylesterase
MTEARSPNEFLFRGGRSGVLLIHGLTGTPSEMRQVGRGLHKAGYSVYGMQLAGHCGGEADLLATGWRDWYASVCEAAARFGAGLDRLFVGGLSMGALLALKYAADHPARVAGLGLYGTTLRYDGWAVPRIARLSFLLPLVTALGLGRRQRTLEAFPYGIRDERIRARIAGAMLAGDSAAAGLAGNPWPSLAQFQRLSWRVQRQLHQVRAPCLLVHAADDDIASVANARQVAAGVRAPSELLLLERSYHMVTVDAERDLVAQRSAAFFRAVLAAETLAGPLPAPTHPIEAGA